MHLAWNDWHEPLANTPDSMLPLPFTFNVSDVGLKPYAATPAPETAAAASFCSWICQYIYTICIDRKMIDIHA